MLAPLRRIGHHIGHQSTTITPGPAAAAQLDLLCAWQRHLRAFSSQASAGADSGAEGAGGAPRGGGRLRELLLYAPALVAAYMCVWQEQRRRWKEDLVQSRAAALQAPERDVFEAASDSAVLRPYTRVSASGRFDAGRSLYVGPRPRSDRGQPRPGYQLVTPLLSDAWGGAGVLVQRGWVPAGWASPPDPPSGVRVEGIVRGSEQPSAFVPANQPGRGTWFWFDAPAMAEACGLPRDTPLLEVIDGDEAELPAAPAAQGPSAMDVLALRTHSPPVHESYPLARKASELLDFKVLPADHRNYALTWLTLSASTFVLARYAIRKGRRVRARAHAS